MADSKRKKKNSIYIILIIILLLIAGISGCQIVKHIIDDKEAEDLNNQLIDDFVQYGDDTTPDVSRAPDDITVPTIEPLPEISTNSEDPPAPITEPVTTDIDNTEETTSLTEETTIPDETTTPAPVTTPEVTQPVVTEPKVTEPKTPRASDDGDNLKIDFNGLKKVNKDIVGWIYGQEGHINFPVLQGETNDTYLRTLYTGKYNINGSIFFHSGNYLYDDDFMILFGHHMRSGAMFGELHQYQSYSYYKSHPYLMYYTPDAKYRLEICIYLKTDTSEKYSLVCRNENEFNSLVADYKSRAVYVTDTPMTYGDHYIILSTCRSSTYKNLRINIFCKMVKVD